jgi:hypothetical protein
VSKLLTVAAALGLLCVVAEAQGPGTPGIFTYVTRDGNAQPGAIQCWRRGVADAGWVDVGKYNTWDQGTYPDHVLRWAHSSISGDRIPIDTLAWYVFRAEAYLGGQFWYSQLSEPFYYKHPWYDASIELPLVTTQMPGPPVSDPTED